MARMQHRSFSSAGRGGSLRRKTEWISIFGALSDLTETSSRVRLAFSQATLAPLVPFTITRTILSWQTAVDAGFITDQDWFVAIGGLVVREPARVVGITAMQTPLSDAGDDGWFLHWTSTAFLEEVLTSNAAVMTSQMHHIDSRAQRKVEDGDAIVFVEEVLGSDAVQTAALVRMLCKLH